MTDALSNLRRANTARLFGDHVNADIATLELQWEANREDWEARIRRARDRLSLQNARRLRMAEQVLREHGNAIDALQKQIDELNDGIARAAERRLIEDAGKP